MTAGLILAGAGLAAAGSPLSARSGPALQPAAGEAVYQQRCEICHGTAGDGNGPAAANMDPRPRDFRRGWYKIRSTANGQLPTDEDLVRIITDGMPGTTMPAWGAVLTPEELQSVAEYIKGFSRRFERETPEPVPVLAAPGSSEERIGRGGQLFSGAGAECAKCHGLAGRGDGPSAGELVDDFSQPIVPADLSAPWSFRGGPSAEDVYLRLKTGLTGSPMPSYADVLSDDELWDLAYYVDSLGEDQPPQSQPFILAAMIEGPLPTTADDARWQQVEAGYYPLVGQLMREPRNFIPGIQAIWVRALHNRSELAL
ncbi:MAG: c-type cytochrome, partial [Anaerolineales bacterium]